MEFTYQAYIDFINWLKKKEYKFVSFDHDFKSKKVVINRHDVDFSLEKAYEIGKIDHSLGIKSTFFILVSSFFYNLFDKKSKLLLEKLMSLGHDIGLHFDETQYPINSILDFEKYLIYECKTLSNIIEKEIVVFSNHRPSEFVLSGIEIEHPIINAYSHDNFVSTKYFSDSRMHWREDIGAKIEQNKYNKIQINTHPFWYSKEEKTIKEVFIEFINKHKKNFYSELLLSTKDFEQIISIKDHEGDLYDKI